MALEMCLVGDIREAAGLGEVALHELGYKISASLNFAENLLAC